MKSYNSDTYFAVNKYPVVLRQLICQYLDYYNIESSYNCKYFNCNYYNCKYEYNNSFITFYIFIYSVVNTRYNYVIEFIKDKCNDNSLYYQLYNDMKISLITPDRIHCRIKKPECIEERNLNIIIIKVSSKFTLDKMNGIIELSKYSIDNSDQILQFYDWPRLLIECLNSDSCNIKKHAIIILANLVNKSEPVKKYLIRNDIFGLDSKLRLSHHKCIVDEYLNLLGNLIFS